MDMSSNHVLGYHVGADNFTFTRFRLLGAYWLSKAIVLNDEILNGVGKWSEVQKSNIGMVIRDAILTDTCSAILFSAMYGNYCLEHLREIYNAIKIILNLKLNKV